MSATKANPTNETWHRLRRSDRRVDREIEPVRNAVDRSGAAQIENEHRAATTSPPTRPQQWMHRNEPAIAASRWTMRTEFLSDGPNEDHRDVDAPTRLRLSKTNKQMNRWNRLHQPAPHEEEMQVAANVASLIPLRVIRSHGAEAPAMTNDAMTNDGMHLRIVRGVVLPLRNEGTETR